MSFKFDSFTVDPITSQSFSIPNGPRIILFNSVGISNNGWVDTAGNVLVDLMDLTGTDTSKVAVVAAAFPASFQSGCTFQEMLAVRLPNRAGG
jgi:hypothetical protein